MNFFKKIYLTRLIIGVVLGAIAGFAYYYYVGCASGSCPLTSNPFLMTLYGVMIGGVLTYKKHENKDEI